MFIASSEFFRFQRVSSLPSPAMFIASSELIASSDVNRFANDIAKANYVAI
jgi:hypothetical protein